MHNVPTAKRKTSSKVASSRICRKVCAVKLPARWVVSFLVSPDDRLGGYTWVGPAHQVRAAVDMALRSAGLGELTRKEAELAFLACEQAF